MDYRKIFFKRKNTLFLSITAGFLLTGVICACINSYSERIQKGIAEKIIRLHVVANSDTDEDQNLKLKVRDAVLEASFHIFDNTDSKSAARKILALNSDALLLAAKNTVLSEGFDYDIKISFNSELFPQREYSGIVFPAGKYEAVRVDIGEAAGHNWWCVMYPPLCYVDASVDGVWVSDGKLKAVLTEEEYKIASAGRNKEGMPKIKLKIIEWWQEEVKGGEYSVRP